MNPIRRYTLHRWNSRHNPLTRAASIIIRAVIIMGASIAVLDALDYRQKVAEMQPVLDQLVSVVEGKTRMVERTGRYLVVREVRTTVYEDAQE